MPNMAPGRWTRLRAGLQTLGLVIGGLLLLQQGISAVQAVFLNQAQLVQPLYLAAAVVTSTLAGAIQILGWLLVMRQVGVRLTWLQAVRGYNLSFLPRYIPGSVWGYLSRSEWLWRYYGVSYGVSNVGSILEVFFILLAGGVFSLAYSLPWLVGKNLLVMSAAVSVALIVAGFVSLKLAPVMLSWARSWLANTAQIMPPIRAQQYGVLFLIYVFLWFCHGTTLLLLTRSLGGSAISAIWPYVVIYYVAWSAGFLVVFVPAGFGVRDNLLSRLLSTLVGLLSSQAIVASILARLTSLLGEAIWVCISLLITKTSEKQGKMETNTQ